MPSATTACKDEIVSARILQPDRGEGLRWRDSQALERFVDLYFGPIYSQVRGLVGSAHEAEEITGDIFRNIHRSLPSLGPKRSLHAWVFAIARNRIRDHWRSRRTFRETDHDDEGTAYIGSARPDSEPDRQERDDEVKQAVYRLPFGMRSVLLLRIYDGLTFKTIAKILKLTPAAARTRYSGALKLVRKSLPMEGSRL